MKRWLIICCFLFSCLLAGCGKGRTEVPPVDGQYQIYYLNPAATKLVAEPFTTAERGTEKLVTELMGQFLQVPPQVDCQTVLTDKVGLDKFRLEESVLYLYFDSNYAAMKPAREILARAALARTFTQLTQVNYIMIYSGEQPLVNRNGVTVGLLSAADFVEGITDVNSFEKTELTLYFTDSTGQILVPETREVVHSVNTSLEKMVVEELIAGPEEGDHFPTMTTDVRLLSVSVNENVCYLNFDDSFVKNSLEINEKIPIYSIVNSLADLFTVNKVQITVNGSQEVMFRESISLNTIFERNLDLIGGTQ